MPGANGYQRRLKVDYKVWHDNITPNLAKTWHHFGISDQNLTSLAQYPKYLRSQFKIKAITEFYCSYKKEEKSIWALSNHDNLAYLAQYIKKCARLGLPSFHLYICRKLMYTHTRQEEGCLVLTDTQENWTLTSRYSA